MKTSNFDVVQGSYYKRNLQLGGDGFFSPFGKWEMWDKETYSTLLMVSARVSTVSSISRICQICWKSSPCNSLGYSARCPQQFALLVCAMLPFLCLWSMCPWQGLSTSMVSSVLCPVQLAHKTTTFCTGLSSSSGFHLCKTQQGSSV